MSGKGRRRPGRLWAAVPYKGPLGSKRRLSGLLDDAERGCLARAMLDDVLDALLASPGIETVLLLTPDRSAIAERGDPCPRLLEDRQAGQPDGLNRAIRAGQQAAQDGGASGLLIVPADLPLLSAADVLALAQTATSSAVVIAPDRTRDGTNALLLTPPLAVTPEFGAASFERHRTLARQANLTCAVLERPNLALDIDTPGDLALLLEADRRSRTARLLCELDVPARLAALAVGQARSTTT